MSSFGPLKWLSDAFHGVLDWFQYFINGIISFITGEGSSGGLSGLILSHWKGLLVIALLIGTVINLLIYVARWKPHWWWFAKKRMVVDDALVEKKQKRAADSAPARKPSTFIPKRIDTNPSHKAPARGSLTDDGDLMATDSDDLMSTHKNKKRQ